MGSISSRTELLISSTVFKLFSTLLSTLDNKSVLSFSFLSSCSLEAIKLSTNEAKSSFTARPTSSPAAKLLFKPKSKDFSKLSCISTRSFALAKLISNFSITLSILFFCSLTFCDIIRSMSWSSSSLTFEPFSMSGIFVSKLLSFSSVCFVSRANSALISSAI